MIDHVIVLAPLLVLGLVLLLGFAGCSFEGAVGDPTLTIRARVPSGLTVTWLQFAWESPSVTRAQDVRDNPSPAFELEGDNVFDQRVTLPLTEGTGTPIAETWTVRCQVTVQGGLDPGPAANGMFTLDGSLTHPIATFQAAGDAAGLTLTFLPVT